MEKSVWPKRRSRPNRHRGPAGFNFDLGSCPQSALIFSASSFLRCQSATSQPFSHTSPLQPLCMGVARDEGHCPFSPFHSGCRFERHARSGRKQRVSESPGVKPAGTAHGRLHLPIHPIPTACCQVAPALQPRSKPASALLPHFLPANFVASIFQFPHFCVVSLPGRAVKARGQNPPTISSYRTRDLIPR